MGCARCFRASRPDCPDLTVDNWTGGLSVDQQGQCFSANRWQTTRSVACLPMDISLFNLANVIPPLKS